MKGPFRSALASGFCLAAALCHPAAGWLAGLALVPLLRLLLTGAVSPLRALLLGWGAGLIGYGALFSYVALALHPAVFLAALLYYAFYTGIFAGGVARCARRHIEYGSLLAPCLWTTLEYLRGLGPLGVPAGSLGAAQVRLLPVVQIAAVTGVFGISFLIVTVNVAVTRLFLFRTTGRPRPAILWTGAAAVLLAGALVYGFRALARPAPDADVLTVAAVQGDIDERGLDRAAIRAQIFDRYRERTLALAGIRPALIVYPETMTGSYLAEDSLFRAFVADLGGRTGSAFLIGSRHLIRDEDVYRLYNSVFAVDAAGRIRGRYDKNRPVPFGEYTPLGGTFPWLARFRVTGAELTPGRRWEPLRLPDGVPAGLGVCYEAMYGADLRRVVREGGRLLVIVSDDVWLRGTVASRQFYDEAVLRAIENRTPVVRCANMGVSGVIDARGRTVSVPLAGAEGVACGAVPLRAETSLYARYGDVAPWLCGLASLGLIAVCLRRGKAV